MRVVLKIEHPLPNQDRIWVQAARQDYVQVKQECEYVQVDIADIGIAKMGGYRWSGEQTAVRPLINHRPSRQQWVPWTRHPRPRPPLLPLPRHFRLLPDQGRTPSQ